MHTLSYLKREYILTLVTGDPSLYWAANGLTFQGNMQFESDGESVQIVGLEAISHISELTATEPESVSKSLLYRTVATGGGEVIEKGHSEQDACFGRDAFAKVLLRPASFRHISLWGWFIVED